LQANELKHSHARQEETMRIAGRIINAADPSKNDIFENFSVQIRYLTLVAAEGDRVFREESQIFRLQPKENRFQFDVPELPSLQEREELVFVVFDSEGDIVLEKKMSLADALKQGDRLELKIANVPEIAAKPPLDINGKLRFKGSTAETDDFTGYRVSVAYRTLQRVEGEPVVLPDSESALLAEGNRFHFSLPNADLLDGKSVAIEARYPDGTVAVRQDFRVDALREELVLELERRAVPTIAGDANADAAKPRKIKGKVVDVAGVNKVSNKQVILWAGNAEVVGPVLTAITDANGNFYGDYPRGRFRRAIATVAGTRNAKPETGVPISLTPGADDGEGGNFPDFVFVPVEFAAADKEDAEDECACDNEMPPRLPDQDDLVSNSSTYSQDIGLNCVNFTTPNRTLEEIPYTLAVRTTEPDIKGTTLSDLDKRRSYVGLISEMSKPAIVASEAARISPAVSTTTMKAATTLLPWSATKGVSISTSKVLESARASTLLDQFKAVPGRGILNAQNSVDWDGTPTFYQSTTIAHGHLLHFKQVWKADGYSMGDLLYSLPLAPGQKKQIVIFDWDRSEFGRRDESSHEDEALSAYLTHDRDVLDVVNTALNESMKGGSSSRTKGSAGGIGAGVGALLGPVMIGVAGGYSTSSGSATSSAWQDSSRNLSANALSQLRDSIQQASSAVRNQRSTVVQTARQTERFKVETETVANYNHCHALTIEYFEILRHYAIEQKLASVQECLFIPLLMSEFDVAKVVRWRDIVSAYLMVARRSFFFGLAFSQDPLERGVDACERIFRNYEGSDFPIDSYASESIVNFSGDLRITFQLNRPRDADDDALDQAKQDELITLAALNASFGWGIFWPLIGGSTYIWSNYFANQKVRNKNKIFEERVAPVIAEAVVDKLIFTAVSPAGVRIPLSVDCTLVSNYQRDAELYATVRPTGAVSIRRDMIEFIEISTDIDLSKSENSKIIIRSATFRYSTAHMNGYLVRDSGINNDLKPTDPVTIYTPLSSEEKRKPRVEDLQYSKKLLEHLNANIEYYHKAIWMNMDQDRRYMLLDGFVAPNSGGRSVASVVENRVVGIAGNCLIMPVAPGYKLDPTYEYEPLLDDNGRPVRNERGDIVFRTTDLIEHYQPRTPLPPYRISVPTRGVFAEAVQGACNACEKIERDRYWRWEESPIPDQPTQIAPVQTQPPQRTDPGKLEPTPFPTPIVAFQNVPNAPEPGATLAGALALLGKPDLFKDITGLEQTQKNALQAMLSNQESAKHFADKATELAMQASNLKHGDSTIDSIKRSVNDGTLDKDTGKSLIEDVFRSQIDGKKTKPDQNTANNSELSKAAAKAVDQGRAVKASQTHPDGTGTTIEQTNGTAGKGGAEPGTTAFDFTVPGGISALAQPDEMSCWATVATMMLGWKTQSTTDMASVVAEAGPEYVTAFKNKTGLKREEKLKFVQQLGMKPDEGNFASHNYDYFLDELKTFGPLWMTVDSSDKELAPHAKILYGMRGDGTPTGTLMRVIDPNGGKRYEITFEQFTNEYESLARETPADQDLFIQIVRFAEQLQNGGETEGTGSAISPMAGGAYALGDAPDTKLKSELKKALDDMGAAGKLGASPLIPFSMIAIATDGNHKYAGVLDDQMCYSASLLKVANLYAAHELRRAAREFSKSKTFASPAAFFQEMAADFNPKIKGAALASVRQVGIGLVPRYTDIFTATGFTGGATPAVEFSDSFAKHMKQMIVPSNNESAGECTRRLGYSYINAALMAAKLYDAGGPTGIWLAGDYSEGKNPYVRIATINDGAAAQVTSTKELAQLFALIHKGKMIGPTESDDMRKLLEASIPVDPPWIGRATVKKFTVLNNKLGKGPLKTNTMVYSEGSVLMWQGDAAKLAAKKLTGEIAVCWQNLRADSINPPFDGIAGVVNQAFAAYIA
jgi:hypothetical protein